MAWCLLLICACFTLTAEGWIQWQRHLMELTSPGASDVIALVAGYLLQAAGMGVAALYSFRRPSASLAPLAMLALAGHFVCAVPAALGTSLTGTVSFGLLMSLFCGIIAAFYLQELSRCVPRRMRGMAFGAAYAASTILTWLLSLTQGAPVGGMPVQLLQSLALCAIAAALVGLADRVEAPDGHSSPNAAPYPIALAALVVLSMSMTKNLGFSFPPADLVSGVSMETSRLFYAVGLVVAGAVNDRNRSWGAILCAAALVTPFALLAVSGEPVPATVLWGIDYFFYGFFSVFRVVLFCDLASDAGRPYLACMGLLFGRIGDAAGTAICRSLSGSTIVLVSVAVMFFAITVLLAARLFRELYAPSPMAKAKRSDAEAFGSFSARHDLSLREREVLQRVLDGQTNAEAAAALYVAETTVKYHVRNILRKTGCANRVELIDLYARQRND